MLTIPPPGIKVTSLHFGFFELLNSDKYKTKGFCPVHPTRTYRILRDILLQVKQH